MVFNANWMTSSTENTDNDVFKSLNNQAILFLTKIVCFAS